MPDKKDAKDEAAADVATRDEPHFDMDSLDANEQARVDLSKVDVELPAGHPGPAPAASRPLNPDAKMSTLDEA